MSDAATGVNTGIIDPLTAILATASYGAAEMKQLRAKAESGTVSASDIASWLRDAEQHFAEIAEAGARISRVITAHRRGVADESWAPPSELPQAVAERPRRVLVIDNEPAILRVVRRMLRQHSVECVAGAREALDLLEADPDYDVILCDIVMPGMTGVDFYESLLTTHPGLARRLVFVTAGTDSVKTAELRRLDPARFVDKPFHASSLLRALERVIH